jgi:hypothetical protein
LRSRTISCMGIRHQWSDVSAWSSPRRSMARSERAERPHRMAATFGVQWLPINGDIDTKIVPPAPVVRRVADTLFVYPEIWEYRFDYSMIIEWL